jgi:hypothetical protein
VQIKPSLQALWLADDVKQDEETGKVTVTGMFDQVEVNQPGEYFTSPAYLFFALNNVHGEAELDLHYVDLSTNASLLHRRFKVKSAGPLETIDVTIRLKPIPFPHPGVYAWELYCGSEQLGSSKLKACVS